MVYCVPVSLLVIYPGKTASSHDFVSSILDLSVYYMPVFMQFPMFNMVIAGYIRGRFPLSVINPTSGCNINGSPSGRLSGGSLC